MTFKVQDKGKGTWPSPLLATRNTGPQPGSWFRQSPPARQSGKARFKTRERELGMV